MINFLTKWVSIPGISQCCQRRRWNRNFSFQFLPFSECILQSKTQARTIISLFNSKFFTVMSKSISPLLLKIQFQGKHRESARFDSGKIVLVSNFKARSAWLLFLSLFFLEPVRQKCFMLSWSSEFNLAEQNSPSRVSSYLPMRNVDTGQWKNNLIVVAVVLVM